MDEQLLRDIGCTTKVRYDTRRAARKAMNKMSPRVDLNVYECRFCGSFHVGHRYGTSTYIRKGRIFE